MEVSGQFHSPPSCRRGKSRPGRFGEEKNLMLLPLIEPVTSSLYPSQNTDCSTALLLRCQLPNASYLLTKHVIDFYLCWSS